jgi:hypothetical protein
VFAISIDAWQSISNGQFRDTPTLTEEHGGLKYNHHIDRFARNSSIAPSRSSGFPTSGTMIATASLLPA